MFLFSKAGLDCDVTNLAGDLPGHLMVDTPSGLVAPSGSAITLKCSDPMESLTIANNPLIYDCYNAVIQNHTMGSYPAADQCFVAEACTAASIVAMGIPGHLERVGTGSVQHASMINFQCTNGKFLQAWSDPDGDNMFNVQCDNGVPVEHEFPSEEMCQAKCTSATGLPAGFLDPGAVEYIEGETIQISCTDPTHYVSADSWKKKTYGLKCLETAAFEVPAAWPRCDVRPECGVPEAAGPGTGLEPTTPNTTTPAGELTTYKCNNPIHVTDVGKTIDIQCQHDGGLTDTAYYKFPNAWGAASMQCREPVLCQELPDIPLYSGLEVGVAPAAGYSEFTSANYTCSNSAHLMYMGDVVMSPMVFNVMCLPPGAFEGGLDWPHCDVANPPRCDQYISVPDGVPVSIVAETPVLPGGSVTYKCDDPTMTTNLGMEVKVSLNIVGAKFKALIIN